MAKRKSPGWDKGEMPGMGWRIALSIISFFLMLAFLVLWLFFHAGAYTVYQNIAVVIVSILVFFGVMGAVWAMWGMRYGPQMEKRARKQVPYPSTVPPEKPEKKPVKRRRPKKGKGKK